MATKKTMAAAAKEMLSTPSTSAQSLAEFERKAERCLYGLFAHGVNDTADEIAVKEKLRRALEGIYDAMPEQAQMQILVAAIQKPKEYRELAWKILESAITE